MCVNIRTHRDQILGTNTCKMQQHYIRVYTAYLITIFFRYGMSCFLLRLILPEVGFFKPKHVAECQM
jgi:hypothetical protein